MVATAGKRIRRRASGQLGVHTFGEDSHDGLLIMAADGLLG